jgi:hypothetical protein
MTDRYRKARNWMAGYACPRCWTYIPADTGYYLRSCVCGDCYVDGGGEYCRVGFKNKEPVRIKMRRGPAPRPRPFV